MNDKNLDPENKNPENSNPENSPGEDILGSNPDNGKNNEKGDSKDPDTASSTDRELPLSASHSPETFSPNNFPENHNSEEIYNKNPSEENPQGLFRNPVHDPTYNPLRRDETGNEGFNPNLNLFPQKKKHNLVSSILTVIGLLTVIFLGIAIISYAFGLGGDNGSSGKVAVIYVQGTILSGNVPSGLGYATSEEISENIRSAVADKNVKAIVLRVNSPGGSPAAAQEIVREIKRAQDKNISVVVSMGDLAASAAYYIAAPTDYIFANPSTSTGSIGVIWTFQDQTVSNKREGVDYFIAKSGDFKDMGSPWRGLTKEEKEYANSVVMESYEDFITQVSEGRNMSQDTVRALADGRIYTGAKAKELGLVDGFGDLYDAIDKAGELGGIEGEPQVVYVNKVSLSKLLLGSDSGETNRTVKQLVSYFEESPYGKIIA